MPAVRHRLPLAARPAPDFAGALARHGVELRRAAVTTLQVNVGKLCNQACHHCHVEAGPLRTEIMSRAVVEQVVQVLANNPGITTLDLTGGAPELNPNFRWLVDEARGLGRHVIDRCNLTVLYEPGMDDLAQFLADRDVEVIASLPCYTAKNVDEQRGHGVFAKSIAGLRALNELGYGRSDGKHQLNLVYNPNGAFLPSEQAGLELTYKAKLARDFGIVFDRLFTITNVPIARYVDYLDARGEFEDYQELLVSHLNLATVPGLMCRSMISVGWDGRLYDCDFNQMLEMPLGQMLEMPLGQMREMPLGQMREMPLGQMREMPLGQMREMPLGAAPTIFDLDTLAFDGESIATGSHCFACTAGSGSSCGGSIA